MKTVLVNYGNFSTEQCVDECLYNAIYEKAVKDVMDILKENSYEIDIDAPPYQEMVVSITDVMEVLVELKGKEE